MNVTELSVVLGDPLAESKVKGASSAVCHPRNIT
jgi:hypothetical protein